MLKTVRLRHKLRKQTPALFLTVPRAWLMLNAIALEFLPEKHALLRRVGTRPGEEGALRSARPTRRMQLVSDHFPVLLAVMLSDEKGPLFGF